MVGNSNRRNFLKGAALAGLAYYSGTARAEEQKLRLGAIGCGGRGGSDLGGVASEQIVALCDVDWSRAADAAKKWPKAHRYDDFRLLLEKEYRNLDAVVVATPDHIHAPATLMALGLGLHVYCEKPLTRTVREARAGRAKAIDSGLVTQMGNQGTAEKNLRTAVEVVQSGAIGEVREVHVWTDRPIWPQGIARPTETPDCPRHLNWDLWLGPSPARPYHPAYHPFKWRGWHDFGTGALGDMGCHNANMAFFALKLGYPTSVQAWCSEHQPETFPLYSWVRYEFPEREGLPPCSLMWYEGKKKPPPAIVDGLDLPSNGSILVGDKGTFVALDSHSTKWKLLPDETFRDYQPPEPTLPRSPGHHQEWILACKGGPKPMSSFDHAAFLTEVIVLGSVAQRLPDGLQLQWDPASGQPVGCPEAEPLIDPPYRAGWKL